jgi:tRNA:m4X modification enzyme
MLPSHRSELRRTAEARAATAAPPAPAEPHHCAQYLPLKRRYCHFVRVEGHEYCGHHVRAAVDPAKGSTIVRERIPCPIDPSHTIYAKDLQRHLKICPKAKEAQVEATLPCFRRDCNLGGTADASQPAALALGDVPTERVHALLERVKSMHAIHAARAAPAPPVLEVAEEGCGRKKAKHGTQHAAMLHVIRTLSASEECAYVELGAGKAGLSQALSEAQPRATYVLVDWAKPQNSADSSMRDRGVRIVRYKLDLRHFWMRGVPELWPPPTTTTTPTPTPTPPQQQQQQQPQPQPQPPQPPQPRAAEVPMALSSNDEDATLCHQNDATRGASASMGFDGRRWLRDLELPPLDAHRLDAAVVGKVEAEAPVCAVVGIAKHLCGCATDFALHSIVSAATVPARENPALSGVVIATCCHHKCSWGTYCNRPFFEELGISAEDFQLLTVISSWATSGAADGGAGSGDRGGGGLNARDDAANAPYNAPIAPNAAADAQHGAPNAQHDAPIAPNAAADAQRGAPNAQHDAPIAPNAAADAQHGAPNAQHDAPLLGEHENADPEAAQLGALLDGRIDAPTRRQLGRMCKRLLDTGRLRYLAQHGYSVRLQTYVDEIVSPENMLIVAQPSHFQGYAVRFEAESASASAEANGESEVVDPEPPQEAKRVRVVANHLP